MEIERLGENKISYLRWIRNPKNSGDLFLPEPLSGVKMKQSIFL